MHAPESLGVHIHDIVRGCMAIDRETVLRSVHDYAPDDVALPTWTPAGSRSRQVRMNEAAVMALDVHDAIPITN